MIKKIAKKHIHITEKRRQCFRQYFGPVHMYPLLFEGLDGVNLQLTNGQNFN